MDINNIMIGASEASRPLGLSKWETPLAFYCRMVGEEVEEDDKETEACYLGKMLEDGIASMFADIFDVKLHRAPTYFHPEDGWLRATPDRYFTFDDAPSSLRHNLGLEVGEWVLVECKSAGLATFIPRDKLDDEWGEPNSDHVPVDYATQVQSQVGVTDAALRFFDEGFVRRGFIKPLLAGRGSPLYRINGDAGIFGGIRKKLGVFVHRHLVPEVPPDPKTAADWKLREEQVRRPNMGKALRPADDGEEAMILRWKKAKATAEAADLELAESRTKLVEMLKHDYGLTGSFGKLLYTASGEYQRCAKGAALDAILDTIKEDKSPLAESIRAEVARKTKKAFSGRALRPTWSDQPTKKKTTDTSTLVTEPFPTEEFPS